MCYASESSRSLPSTAQTTHTMILLCLISSLFVFTEATLFSPIHLLDGCLGTVTPANAPLAYGDGWVALGTANCSLEAWHIPFLSMKSVAAGLTQPPVQLATFDTDKKFWLRYHLNYPALIATDSRATVGPVSSYTEYSSDGYKAKVDLYFRRRAGTAVTRIKAGYQMGPCVNGFFSTGSIADTQPDTFVLENPNSFHIGSCANSLNQDPQLYQGEQDNSLDSTVHDISATLSLAMANLSSVNSQQSDLSSEVNQVNQTLTMKLDNLKTVVEVTNQNQAVNLGQISDSVTALQTRLDNLHAEVMSTSSALADQVAASESFPVWMTNTMVTLDILQSEIDILKTQVTTPTLPISPPTMPPQATANPATEAMTNRTASQNGTIDWNSPEVKDKIIEVVEDHYMDQWNTLVSAFGSVVGLLLVAIIVVACILCCVWRKL